MKTLLHSAFPISSVGLVARKVGRSRIWGILALGLAMSGIALGQSMELVGLSVAGRGPHHTVWQRVQRLVDGSGNSVLFTNRWTELATGLNFFDSKAGDWTETRQAFDISPEGYAIAARGQHRVILAADINDGGSVDLDMPDGKRLVSNPMGLSYVDTASGKNVLLAEVTNCIGQLVAANVVLYPAAFDTLKAALRMTYSQSGFEQDVLLLENPGSPADYGLDPATTRLAIYTEFHAPPSPTIATSGNSDEDALVQFGSMTIGSGRAYGLAGEGTPVGVQKLWTTIHQRTFLIESVPYTEIKPLLANLHASVPRNIKNAVAKRVVSDREQLLAAGFMRARKKSESLVRISPDRRVPSEGVTIDYYISLTNAYANYTFHSGETYYLSGPVSLSGQTVFEPACVLKYAPTNNARLTLTTPVSWLGEPYRPIVLTGRDDPTVGASVTNTSFTGTYATAALEINATNPVNLAYVRVTAAQNAIVINNSSHCCPVTGRVEVKRTPENKGGERG